MILALSLGESVVNHLARRCFFVCELVEMQSQVGDELRTTFPCRDSRIK